MFYFLQLGAFFIAVLNILAVTECLCQCKFSSR